MTFEEAMEPLYEYVDGLPDEARDRIVTGRFWRAGAMLYRDGARCLVGHVANVQASDVTAWAKDLEGREFGCVFFDESEVRAYDPMLGRGRVHILFDGVCIEFGEDRVVRAIKLRAAAATSANPSLTLTPAKTGPEPTLTMAAPLRGEEEERG